MGALLSFGRIRKVKVASRVAQVLHDKDEENVNRRNSLAYNLEEYVKLKGDDPTRLLLEIENHMKENLPEQRKKDRIRKVPQNTKIGNDVLHGNMRVLKNQVILHFNHINRRFRDNSHNGNAMLHFICQEVSQQYMRIE